MSENYYYEIKSLQRDKELFERKLQSIESDLREHSDKSNRHFIWLIVLSAIAYFLILFLIPGGSKCNERDHTIKKEDNRNRITQNQHT